MGIVISNAHMAQGEAAFGVNYDGGGQAAGVVHRGQIIRHPIDGEVVAFFGFKGFGLFKIGIKRNQYKVDAVFFISVKLCDSGHFGDTGRAPGRPEVDEIGLLRHGVEVDELARFIKKLHIQISHVAGYYFGRIGAFDHGFVGGVGHFVKARVKNAGHQQAALYGSHNGFVPTVQVNHE